MLYVRAYPICAAVSDQVYALERLMRGLGSGRQGARQGFALALTVLLREIPAIPTPWILASLTTHLKVSSSMKVLKSTQSRLGNAENLESLLAFHLCERCTTRTLVGWKRTQVIPQVRYLPMCLLTPRQQVLGHGTSCHVDGEVKMICCVWQSLF